MKNYDKYSAEWFIDKLDNYVYKTGAREEELMWVISEDLISILLKRNDLNEYRQIGVFAADIHNQLYKDGNTPDIFKINKKVVATILKVLCIYTDELKDTVILIKVR